MSYYAKRFFGQTQSEGIVTDGLKLWLDASNPASYPGSGTTWYDLSGNGNNGTMVNGVTYSTANGGVMRFDGVNDYVGEVTQALNIQNNIPYSISIVFNSSSIGLSQQLLGNWNTLVDKGWRIDISGSKIRFLLVNSNGVNGFAISSSNSIYSNTIYILTITYSGIGSASGYNFYLNGVLISTTISANTNIGTILNNKITIGASQINTTNYANYFKGLLNDVLIYSRALTQAEITQNFNATKSKYGL